MLRKTPLALALSIAALPQPGWAQATSSKEIRMEATLSPVKVTASAQPSAQLPTPYVGG